MEPQSNEPRRRHRLDSRGRKKPGYRNRIRTYERDGWRCRFVLEDGSRCQVKGSLADHSMLTLEHIVPVSVGGGNVGNLETLCFAHNQLRGLEHNDALLGISRSESSRGRPSRSVRFLEVAKGAHLLDELTVHLQNESDAR